jgi:hypothetical protein
MGKAVEVMEGEDAARRWLYGGAFRLVFGKGRVRLHFELA